MADDESSERDTSDNAANPDVVGERKLTHRQLVVQRKEVLRSLMASAAGREWLAWLVIEQCGLFHTSISGDANPNFTLIREGARNIGLTVQKSALQDAPDLYMVLLAENAHKI
jgi:hypothetical protein